MMARIHHAPPVLHASIGGRPVRAFTHAELSRRARHMAGWVLTWAPDPLTAPERAFLVGLLRGRGVLPFATLERLDAIKARAGAYLDRLQRETGGTGQDTHARR
jgi:hypothetical protein